LINNTFNTLLDNVANLMPLTNCLGIFDVELFLITTKIYQGRETSIRRKSQNISHSASPSYF